MHVCPVHHWKWYLNAARSDPTSVASAHSDMMIKLMDSSARLIEATKNVRCIVCDEYEVHPLVYAKQQDLVVAEHHVAKKWKEYVDYSLGIYNQIYSSADANV